MLPTLLLHLKGAKVLSCPSLSVYSLSLSHSLGIFHVACPYPVEMLNVQETLIKPGIEGTENVINTALKTQSVQVGLRLTWIHLSLLKSILIGSVWCWCLVWWPSTTSQSRRRRRASLRTIGIRTRLRVKPIRTPNAKQNEKLGRCVVIY